MLLKLLRKEACLALNNLEIMVYMVEIDAKEIKVLTPDLLKEILDERSARFKNKGNRYYNLICALHKSGRGLPVEATLY